MVVQNVLHMNAGNGETSYANNSTLQKTAILMARPVLEDTLKKVYNNDVFPKHLKIADLGCSSGPNTFLVISQIINIIHNLMQQNNCKAPEIEICLNDLPQNDFNNIFKSLPTFYKKIKTEKEEKLPGTCFVSGVPGSFYCRLFPRKSLHFVHSSYSVHWLSQVPERLENKGNIYMARTSPPTVFEAYLKQFQMDFSTFLSLRSEEIVVGGPMILTFLGRRIADPTDKDCCILWELLTKSLLDLVPEGLIQKEAIDSFNFPFYYPYKGEVKAIIEKEGSFNLERLEVSECNWDANDNDDDEHFVFDKDRSGKNVANLIRAVTEPLVVSHFGEFIVDDVFKKFTNHVADHLCSEKSKFINIVVSLSKK
ncbi:Benzoate carboxyl methyltransferase [Camellia lanceoleosa]|uniref:Benzoate carboxyl methyltransferase n=1 Tax=Camellia lanceoleosa TaxID=1840588 RepID=A0ACC0IRZ8_9ERIC|nr:Benzoate carboxyl methyltransferase [Camellia lanceoleosa]